MNDANIDDLSIMADPDADMGDLDDSVGSDGDDSTSGDECSMGVDDAPDSELLVGAPDDVWLMIIAFISNRDIYFFAAVCRRALWLVRIARRRLQTRWGACTTSLSRFAWGLDAGPTPVLRWYPPEMLFAASLSVGCSEVVSLLATEVQTKWPTDDDRDSPYASAYISAAAVGRLDMLAFVDLCTGSSRLRARSRARFALYEAARVGNSAACVALATPDLQTDADMAKAAMIAFKREHIDLGYSLLARGSAVLSLDKLSYVAFVTALAAIRTQICAKHGADFGVRTQICAEHGADFGVPRGPIELDGRLSALVAICSKMRDAEAPSHDSASTHAVGATRCAVAASGRVPPCGPAFVPFTQWTEAMFAAIRGGHADACRWLIGCARACLDGPHSAESGEWNRTDLRRVISMSITPGFSFLARAAKRGHADICQLILDAGGPWTDSPPVFNRRNRFPEGNIECVAEALGYAATSGHVTVCAILIPVLVVAPDRSQAITTAAEAAAIGGRLTSCRFIAEVSRVFSWARVHYSVPTYEDVLRVCFHGALRGGQRGIYEWSKALLGRKEALQAAKGANIICAAANARRGTPCEWLLADFPPLRTYYGRATKALANAAAVGRLDTLRYIWRHFDLAQEQLSIPGVATGVLVHAIRKRRLDICKWAWWAFNLGLPRPAAEYGRQKGQNARHDVAWPSVIAGAVASRSIDICEWLEAALATVPGAGDPGDQLKLVIVNGDRRVLTAVVLGEAISALNRGHAQTVDWLRRYLTLTRGSFEDVQARSTRLARQGRWVLDHIFATAQ